MIETRNDAFAFPFNYVVFEQVRLATYSTILIINQNKARDINGLKREGVEFGFLL
jgi:hypothetical protein